MKNIILIAATFAFALNIQAQQTCNNTCSVGDHLFYANDKMPDAQQHVGNNTYSLINPEWKIAYAAEVAANAAKAIEACNSYRMAGHTMMVENSGTSACMYKYVTLQNGAVLLPNGALISLCGEIVHLKNGDTIDAQGTLTNIATPEIIKEQATL